MRTMASARAVNQWRAIEHSTRSALESSTPMSRTSLARRSAATPGKLRSRSRNTASIGGDASIPTTLSTPSRGIASSEANPVPQPTSSSRG